MALHRQQSLIPLLQARLGRSEAEIRAILQAVADAMNDIDAERKPGMKVTVCEGVMARRPPKLRKQRSIAGRRQRAYNPSVPGICAVCGRRFLAQRRTAKYCGEWCSIRSWMARKGLRVSSRHYVAA